MNITDGEFMLHRRFQSDVRVLTAEANATILSQNATIRQLKAENAALRRQLAALTDGSRIMAAARATRARLQG